MIVYGKYADHVLTRLLAEQPQARAAGRSAVGNRAFYAQFDFRPTSPSAPDGQLRADLFGALTHSGQAVMAGAPLLQDFRCNALPIVPNPQLELVCVDQFGFNVLRQSVAEGISQSLASNAINLVSNDRMQIPRRTLHH